MDYDGVTASISHWLSDHLSTGHWTGHSSNTAVQWKLSAFILILSRTIMNFLFEAIYQQVDLENAIKMQIVASK